VESVIASLKRLGDKRTRDQMGPRYGIHLPDPSKAFGVGMAALQKVAKGLGQDHEMAVALWKSGWYEARLLASLIDDPAKVTSAQMDQWCRDFDNWGVVDTMCFKLFDRVPPELALRKVDQWVRRKHEFQKRAGFVLLACLALHDKKMDDEPFARRLPLLERGASDDRNFVKKGVSWALRAIGRRSRGLNVVAMALATRLAASDDGAARWVGKDALGELGSIK
jgi:3-methyladenine DNA glycosylase AlkD